MNLILFVIGVIIDISGVGFSYYPIFQDFDEEYIIPFPKNEDYPNQRDLIVTNVYFDCQLSDNIYSQYEIYEEPICDISKNLLILFIGVIFVGCAIMVIGAVHTPKKIKTD